MLIRDVYGSVDHVQFLRLLCPCGEYNCPHHAEHTAEYERMYPVQSYSAGVVGPSSSRTTSPRQRAEKLLADGGTVDEIRTAIVDWIAEDPSVATRDLAEALTAREGDGGYQERLLGVLAAMFAGR